MSTSKAAWPVSAQEGLGLANSLRECLVGGVILLGAEAKTATLNPEAAKLLGIETDAVGETPGRKLPKPLLKIAREAFAAKQPKPGQRVELALDRGRITVEVNAVPLRVGGQSLAVLVLHDLSAAERVEQQVHQLDRLADVGLMAASMAHEIKNALVAGKTFVDLLLEKNKDAELTNVVRREMTRIEGLVARMLRFSRPAPPGRGEVRLHELLEHSLRVVQPQLDGKSITVECVFRATPDQAAGDEHRLEQAFVNLLLNALQAMGPRGNLTITTELVAPTEPGVFQATSGPPHFRITIRDTGEGIPPENLARLFQPFFTTKPSGTGLGLAITQRIIHEHRGTITVKSQPGSGTTFTIQLPAAGSQY